MSHLKISVKLNSYMRFDEIAPIKAEWVRKKIKTGQKQLAQAY
jgi:hypothetical protein